MSNKLKSGDALIVVDVQNDFCEGAIWKSKARTKLYPY